MYLSKKIKSYSKGRNLWSICEKNPRKTFLNDFIQAVYLCRGYPCSLHDYMYRNMCYVKREDIH